MIQQFDSGDYHEAMYEMGKGSLRALSAIQKDIPGIPEGLSGVTVIEDYRRALPFTVTSEYRARVVDDISPDIMHAHDGAPEYVVEMLGSLALALVDHVTITEPCLGYEQIFPPNAQWLKNHIAGLWLTCPEPDQASQHEMTVLSVGECPNLDLVLAKDAGDKAWAVDYVSRCSRILTRSL